MSEISAVRLADFCTTGSGGTPSRAELARYYEGGTIPWVKSGELREKLISRTEEYVTEAALKESSIKLVPAGAILLAMYGATVGRLGLLGMQATTNQAVCHIVPDPKVADTRYVFHAISHRVPNLIAMGVGGAQPNINQGIIKDLAIRLPALAEQRRIAAILDQADALRVKRRETLAQLDSLTQAIFVDMFGDPSTNIKGIPSVYLSEVTSRITDGTHLTPSFINAGVPFIFVKNFSNGQINFQTDKFISEEEYAALYKRCPVEQGDVLYTTVGATYGQAAAIGAFTKFAFQRHVAHLKPDAKKILPEFLGIIMQLSFVKHQADRWARGAAQPTINLTELRQFKIPLPPMKMQAEFAKRVAAISKLKAAQQASLTQLDTLFAALQHRAFRGEL